MSSLQPAPQHRSPFAVLALVVVAMLWGSTFFSVKELANQLPFADVLAVRFTIAALVMVAIGWRHLRMDRKTLIQGIILGILWGAGQLLQTWGMDMTTASSAAFISGLYVVITPILAWSFFRHHVPKVTWLAVIIAVIGMFILSFDGQGIVFSFGTFITFLSAIAYAAHITTTGEFSTAEKAMSLSVVLSITLAIMCWLFAFEGGIVFPHTTSQWMWMLYLAILCGALTTGLQTWAQARVATARAAIILSMEPVWAATFAVISGQEKTTWQMIVGGGIMFAAMLMVVIVGSREKPSDPAEEPAVVL